VNYAPRAARDAPVTHSALPVRDPGWVTRRRSTSGRAAERSRRTVEPFRPQPCRSRPVRDYHHVANRNRAPCSTQPSPHRRDRSRLGVGIVRVLSSPVLMMNGCPPMPA
jgi:hypothetical protein